MTRAARTTVFAAGALGMVALLAWGMAGLPSFGDFSGAYSELIAEIGLPSRHATNLVATTTFDFRALDTLGEELILFASGLGVLVLLRTLRDENPVAADPEEQRSTAGSRSIATVAALAAAPVLVLGAYVIAHGHLTPGGGFQGGVILATAGLMVYIAGAGLRHGSLAPIEVMERAESLGAGGFALIGVGGLIFAAAFLENFLPLGVAGELLSGGTIPLLNVAVGFEVAGAVLLILGELLDQRLLGGPEE